MCFIFLSQNKKKIRISFLLQSDCANDKSVSKKSEISFHCSLSFAFFSLIFIFLLESTRIIQNEKRNYGQHIRFRLIICFYPLLPALYTLHYWIWYLFVFTFSHHRSFTSKNKNGWAIAVCVCVCVCPCPSVCRSVSLCVRFSFSFLLIFRNIYKQKFKYKNITKTSTFFIEFSISIFVVYCVCVFVWFFHQQQNNKMHPSNHPHQICSYSSQSIVVSFCSLFSHSLFGLIVYLSSQINVST